MARSSGRILVIEDDPAIRRGMVDALACAGFGAVEAGDAVTGARMAMTESVDLVLLDVQLPGGDGFEVLGRIRAEDAALPIIMVTARGAEADRVRGLRGGADDYVTKPFSATELVARVEAVLRRVVPVGAAARVLSAGGLRIDLGSLCAEAAGTRCSLTDREAGILGDLAAHSERAVSREELLHRVWGLDPRGLTTRTVDMHVARLREKLAALDEVPVIATVRGRGYMLAEGVAAAGTEPAT